MGSVYVAIYQPNNQTLGTYHWALCLEIGEETTIFQIIGEPNKFTYSEISAKPDDSIRHIENLDIGSIDDVDHFREVVRTQRIDNDMYHWGCQQWVIDVLESLHEEGVIGDYCYAEAKENLEAIFGAGTEGEE
ncbi:hypothetical protein FQN52_008663 [Onygenales sp. PD_12]|nr:hypothetical protein FQN53_007714 [Emmonsiellopsis sp. PD_33]KAK2794305.1 hypothetical protein FQN52_008663 [Onygenales sp. PD_12]